MSADVSVYVLVQPSSLFLYFAFVLTRNATDQLAKLKPFITLWLFYNFKILRENSATLVSPLKFNKLSTV